MFLLVAGTAASFGPNCFKPCPSQSMVQAALKLALVPIVNLSLDAKKETVKHMIKFCELQDISRMFFRLFYFYDGGNTVVSKIYQIKWNIRRIPLIKYFHVQHPKYTY